MGRVGGGLSDDGSNRGPVPCVGGPARDLGLRWVSGDPEGRESGFP